MSGWLKKEIDFRFIINPFYFYSIAFSFSLFLYFWRWSKLFPSLSAKLLLFLIITILFFIIAGKLSGKKSYEFNFQPLNPKLTDLIFAVIILLGVVNIFYMGFIPVFDRSHNYREYGMPVIDPLFNSLSIFFSVFLFRAFLDTRKKRFFFYFILILGLQLLIFRRSAIVWILASSSILFLYKKKIRLCFIIVAIIVIPIFSYCFGLYGIFRSKLSESFIMNDLGASNVYQNSGFSYNHYMTYLYIASPLANLQENINKREDGYLKDNYKNFLFYSIIPESFTMRLEKPFHLLKPSPFLISPNLLAGSFYMVGNYTLGWKGMIMMVVFLALFILLSLYFIKKWNTFGPETYSLLTVTVSLLIFSNFLNRLDVILMLFIYPVLFHFIYTYERKSVT